MVTAAIRQVDKNHIVILGGAQWDGNFTVFHDWKFDDKMMYTCHRYWCDTLQANVQDFVDFRNKTNRPIYLGETGENTDIWVDAYRRLLEKKWHRMAFLAIQKNGENELHGIRKGAGKTGLKLLPLRSKTEAVFEKIRKAKPSPEKVRNALKQLLENIQAENCSKNAGYIKALGMHP